jgi:hypothetical protein
MLVTLFLGVPYRLIAFFSAYIASLVDLSVGVCVCMRVTGGVVLLRVLLAIATVRKVGIRVDFRGLRVRNIGLSVA